ncbi:YfcE family phosphodiesterase [Anaerobacillus alkalidiazotrophicus]|uniref:Phosphoesterase n=1 Tax=Anaerobacillus alkalidiazotrophicus TaxID=472963 RepID=A0A1S2M565_9BACI|nr:metallophosphoesterase [Anaerobacillus alkalidiazotrophicus]OIJ18332.1 YfcE family phosphodiesterase [Anaerobacillus alkalidiazotrophicus]OIJ19811.1 YfcE family phosphodiesterase [Anaerobacillus alkalidiazotrophicus]
MKVLVISDSHGLRDELFGLLDRYESEVDIIIHCGDSEIPNKAFSAYDNLLIVGGNCDFGNDYQDEINIEISGINIFVSHGHYYNVKESAVKLSYRAEELGAKLVCFGHSHIAVAFQENGVVYINPGSFRLPRKRMERSYAIIDFKEDTAYITFFDHKGNEIQDLKYSFQLV